MTERQIDSQSSINHANNVQILVIGGVFLFLAILTAYPVRAQESGQQALSNIELEYTYSDGGAVVLKIGDGILGYRWIAGSSAGYEVTERRYQSRKIAAEVYLVNWHDSENSDYVNLVIDLNEMVVHGSALAAYDSETPFAFFDLAKIARVDKLER
jgi:hypothetical protein